jgi:hypothetical protein
MNCDANTRPKRSNARKLRGDVSLFGVMYMYEHVSFCLTHTHTHTHQVFYFFVKNFVAPILKKKKKFKKNIYKNTMLFVSYLFTYAEGFFFKFLYLRWLISFFYLYASYFIIYFLKFNIFF